MNFCPFFSPAAILALVGLAPSLPADEPRNVLGEDFIVNGDTQITVELEDQSEFVTRKKFSPPLKITYRLKTDNDIRLGYGADQIILNWGMNHQELRIDGGPANKQHVKGGGHVPKNEFLTLTQIILPDRMTLSVNGAERASWEADFSKVHQQIRIFPHRSTITVKKILVEKLDLETKKR